VRLRRTFSSAASRRLAGAMVRMWPLSSFSVCRPPCSGGAATSPLLLRHALLVLRWCDSGSSLVPPPLDLYGDRIELLLRHFPFSDHPPMPQSPDNRATVAFASVARTPTLARLERAMVRRLLKGDGRRCYSSIGVTFLSDVDP
jgi:hypothetical protein